MKTHISDCKQSLQDLLMYYLDECETMTTFEYLKYTLKSNFLYYYICLIEIFGEIK